MTDAPDEATVDLWAEAELQKAATAGESVEFTVPCNPFLESPGEARRFERKKSRPVREDQAGEGATE